MKDELVSAVKKLRKALGESQQAFATRLGLAIRTIANYEAGRRPSGKTLLALANAAAVAGRDDLAKSFLDALSAEFDQWPFQILMIPASKESPPHGYLLFKIKDGVQLQAARSFLTIASATKSTDLGGKQIVNAALGALHQAAVALRANPVAEQINEALSKVSFQKSSE